MRCVLCCVALCAILSPSLCSAQFSSPASDPIAEPIQRADLDAWYAGLKATGAPPRKPRLTFGDKMRVGHVGTIHTLSDPLDGTPHYKVDAIQVLPEKRVIASVDAFTAQIRYVGNQAVPGAMKKAASWTVIFEGIDGVVDDQQVPTEGDWEVKKTETYETLAGTNTVFVLVKTEIPAPPAPAGETKKGKRETKAAPRETPEPELRTWKDGSGKFSIVAKFKGFAAGNVRIEAEDGRSITVPLTTLSGADQKYVRERAKQK